MGWQLAINWTAYRLRPNIPIIQQGMTMSLDCTSGQASESLKRTPVAAANLFLVIAGAGERQVR
jgi:hypothetical protein